jgi:DNA polymerase I-like protein with 3'-5' exonuclease and polymerase domains
LLGEAGYHGLLLFFIERGYMKVLVNYEDIDKGNLSSLSYILKGLGISAVATKRVMTPSEMVETAKTAGCQAILICNTESLLNCVPNPKATLDAFRGSVFRYSLPALVINRLAHIHTVPHGSFLLQKDVLKLTTLNQKVPPFKVNVLNNQDEYSFVIDRMATSLLTAYDIETITLLENEDACLAGETLISCAGWSILLPSGHIETYVLPMIDFGVDHWVEPGQYEKAIEFLRSANALPTPKVMHNGLYDCTHSIAYHAEPQNFCLDTMALAHAEFTELPKSLDFVASIHLPDYVQWKDDAESASKTKDIRKYWAYNGKDTWHTLRVCIEQLRNMPTYAKHNFADKFKLVYPALYCAYEGFAIDQPVLNEVTEEAQTQLDKDRELLRTYVADPGFNPGSWQQVEKYVYKVFGAVKPKIGKSKSCTDEKNLEAVGDQHPLLALLTTAIISYRGNQKAIGTYFKFLQKNARLLWSLNPFGTESERMACNSSSFWCGTQVQNIPKYAKKFLIADEGFELAEADNKQSEGRCTAYLAQDVPLIEALESKTHDFYKVLGTLFFQIPYEEVTQFFRDKVLKRIVHGTNYMMGPKTFKENIGIKILHETASILGFKLVPNPSKKRPEEKKILEFCKELLEKYHVPFKRVRKWYDEIKHEVATTGKLVSPLGHVRHFFGNIQKDHNMLRSAVAHQPQNLSVSILNMGLWKIYKKLVVQPEAPLKVGDYRLKAQIHDSILAQYKVEHRETVVSRMLKYMDNPIMVHGRELRIPVDCKVGTVWSKCEDYKPKEIV